MVYTRRAHPAYSYLLLRYIHRWCLWIPDQCRLHQDLWNWRTAWLAMVRLRKSYKPASADFLMHRIFIICGVSTIAAGLLAFLVIPSSPRHTQRPWWPKGWLNEREADVFIARLIRSDPTQGSGSTMKITLSDM